jgi:solute carrier family 25 carnitine/acylcarnitine transporter 20/29
MQSNKSNQHINFLAVGKEIYAHKGVRGFFKGFCCTLNRDIFSFGFYFYIYFQLKEYWESQGTLNTFKTFCAGGLAGCVSWVIGYPFDPMKTMIQTSSDNVKITQKEAFLYIKNTHGLNGFFRGISPTLLKSFIACGVTFKTNEVVRDYLHEKFSLL